MPKISELTSAGSLNTTDVLPLSQGSNSRKATLAQVRDAVASGARWTPYTSGTWTSLPLSTSSVGVTTTAGVVVGQAIRIAQGAGYLYGVVTSLVSNTSITFAGAALNTGSNVTALEIGGAGTVGELVIDVPGLFAITTSTTVISSVAGVIRRWGLRQAVFVEVRGTQRVADTSSQPSINVLVGGNRIIGSGNGIALTTAGTWVTSGPASMNTSNYTVNRDTALEVECTVVAGAGKSEDLSLSIIFVVP